MFLFTMGISAHNKPYADIKRQSGCTALRKERQRNAYYREFSNYHPHIEHTMDDDHGKHTDADVFSERIPCDP